MGLGFLIQKPCWYSSPQPRSKPHFAAHLKDEEGKNWLRTEAGQKKLKWELLLPPSQKKKKTHIPFWQTELCCQGSVGTSGISLKTYLKCLSLCSAYQILGLQ